MNAHGRSSLAAVVLAAGLAGAGGIAHAAGALPASGGFSPAVPVSAFARPAAWLDPSRINVTTSFTVGAGRGGSQALQVTRLSYQFEAPLALAVSLGNVFGGPGGGELFLEGLDLAIRPHPAFQIQVHYQDLRSPLQFQSHRGFWSTPGR